MREGEKGAGGNAPAKVVWSASERGTIVRRAIEIQKARPDLAGLPLFREAMMALPSKRRRKVVALTQVPWFEMGLRLAAVRSADDEEPSAGKLAKARNALLEKSNRLLEAIWEETVHLHGTVTKTHDQTVGVCLQLLTEIRALNANLAAIRIASSATASNGQGCTSGGRRSGVQG